MGKRKEEIIRGNLCRGGSCVRPIFVARGKQKRGQTQDLPLRGNELLRVKRLRLFHACQVALQYERRRDGVYGLFAFFSSDIYFV